MANKKISELDQTLNLSDQADFPLSQDNGGEPTTFRAKLTQIATKIAEAITFSNLKTGNKQLVSAVNQTISNLADDFNTTAGSTYAKDDCVLYNGVLYQCINNSGTTSGTFIDADWTAIKAVDVGSGGGGGGGAGGHTIVDDAGTSLTQRTNLQFKGAYSEDNSTDDTTEVNVVREMTKAEFDLLSADEKTGFINITDITGGNDDRFQPVIYSEEEREIGVYTDGKPLYQKTIISTSELSKETINQIALGITDIDVCVSVSGFASYGSNNTYIPLPYGDKENSLICLLNINRASSVANVWVGSDYTSPSTVNIVIITLRYTKTTDQAGSGQWTPQGVPAHHYSTDEQVVGTWIDGSTVYEKTIYNGDFHYTTQTPVQFEEIGTITDIDKVISIETTISNSSKTSYQDFNYNPSNQKASKIRVSKSTNSIEFASSDNWGTSTSGSVLIVTIRYTKSST